MFKSKVITALGLATAVFTTSASATSIGWNATAGAGFVPGFGADELAASDIVGATGYAQANWNNHQLGGQGPGATPLVLNDETGTATSVSITGWELVGPGVGNGWAYGNTSSPDAKMHNAYTSGQFADSIDLTYSGLNAFAPQGYDVVVYYGSSATGVTANVTVNGSTIAVTNTESIGTVGYIEYVDASTGSNYAVFSNQTSDVLVISADTNDFGVTGIQISAVPEPTSLALVGLGGLMMLKRRRRD